MTVLLSILVTIVVIVVIIHIIGRMMSAPRYNGPVSDHFNGKTFINPTGIKAKGPRDVLKWMFNRKRGPWTYHREPSIGKKPSEKISAGVRITFINHSTFLIQGDGLNILTDPVFSDRVSPFTWAGPKRMQPPGISFNDLPKIDVVLLSHNHYDHLDIDTVWKLHQKFHPTFVVPLGVAAYLNNNGVNDCVELDWWQSTSFQSLTIDSTPAQHFSGRGFLDRDATLWCGFIIRTARQIIYFAGDTGYNSKTFKEIGAKYSSIDVALIPIGAYKPEWFMSPIHCSPEEAVRIHRDVHSAKSIAAHFGTFPLADEGQADPKRALEEAKKSHGLSDDEFIALKEGTYFETVN